ncbi:Uncharacterised protein [Klebsiella grimontii]|uniref:Uncharacterized protein n=1 Tax=Klebsiella grimontii TaxID=2058152 RepID=A0A7H4P5N7_9ENTR|nr:Uncharacterised protein [Klebsiella grimontii]
MASTTKPARKKFRVAVSGATVDGREIQAAAPPRCGGELPTRPFTAPA